MQHLAPVIRDLAVILVVAGLVSLVFHRIRQPVVLGYVLAGIIVGPYLWAGSPLQVTDLPNIRVWADVGVIFLMFSLGLEFSFRKLAKVGVSAAATAWIEVGGMLLAGFALARWALGWGGLESLFLGALLAISSTTILIKALEELGLKTRRFAEMIFAVLVVEDLLAMLLLVALTMASPGSGEGTFSALRLLVAAGKLGLVVGAWFVFGYFAVPKLVRYAGRVGSEEILTLLALGLCFALSVMAAELGYSVALGAFIMGSILSESSESSRIEDVVGPLRDVFGAIFFVSVGMLLDPRALSEHLWLVLGITGAYLVAKIFFVALGAVVTGQPLKTAVQMGFGLAQIGEFSFIIAALAQRAGVGRGLLFPVAVAVSLITTFLTPYLIRLSRHAAPRAEEALPERLRQWLERYSSWCEQRRADAATRARLYGQLLRWFLNGLVVSVVFLVIAELQARPRGWVPAAAGWAGWLVSILASAPFLWGMLRSIRYLFDARRLSGTGGAGPVADAEAGSFSRRRGDLYEENAPLGALSALALAGLSVGWIGALSLAFLPPRFAVGLALASMSALFVLFYRSLERSYRWFERHFLDTFEGKPKTRRAVDLFRHLAPWDAHLVRLKIHPNAAIAGRTLADSRLRSEHGMTVVAIRRGFRSLIAPRPEEQLFPKDELLVLATDEQIEAVRAAIESPPEPEAPGERERGHSISSYELKPLRVRPGSELAGKSIRQCGIRERYACTVVGLEKGDLRVVNPGSETAIQAGDVLWIVGDSAQLAGLATLVAAAPPAPHLT